MKLKQINSLILSVSFIALVAGCGSPETSEEAGSSADEASVDKEIVITANDQMKFNLESFEVEAGQTIRLTLNNVGTMPKMSMGHNVVILKQGTDQEAFVEASAQAPTNDYIPSAQTDSIIAHTKMLGGGESDSIVFDVPSKKGSYPFLCSFPGHYQVGMKGTMVVR